MEVEEPWRSWSSSGRQERVSDKTYLLLLLLLLERGHTQTHTM